MAAADSEDKNKKSGKYSVERTYKVEAGYLDKFRELISDLSIEVKKNFDRKKRDFMVRPRAPGSYPAVIVLHDWWGMNDFIRMTCMRLAKEGFVAQAISLYNGEESEREDIAKFLMRHLDPDEGLKTVERYVEAVSKMSFVNPRKIVVLGYMMGGFYSLVTASRIRTLAGSVVYYGRFPKSVDAYLKKVSCPLLLFSGGLADWLENEEVNSIEKNLEAYHKEARVIRYEHSSQAFFDDLHIADYDYVSSEDSWRQTLEFLRTAYKKQDPLTHPQIRKYFGKLGIFMIRILSENGLGMKFLDLVEDAIGEEENPAKKSKLKTGRKV